MVAAPAGSRRRAIALARRLGAVSRSQLHTALALLRSYEDPTPVPTESKAARGMFWGTVVILTAAVSATVGAGLALFLPLNPAVLPIARHTSLRNLWQAGLPYRLHRPMNVVIAGINPNPQLAATDAHRLNGASDALMLVQIDPLTEAIEVLSLPRATPVNLPGQGRVALGQANAIGGAASMARAITLNFDQLPVDRYVRLEPAALVMLVDTVGGVEVFLPRAMRYHDRTQGLTIALEPGWQTLNGDQAMQFIQFRDPATGDLGRIQRQQVLLRALRDRLTSPTVLPRLPAVAQRLRQMVDTNLTRAESLAIAQFLVRHPPDQLYQTLLPGEGAGDAWAFVRPQSDGLLDSFRKPEDRGVIAGGGGLQATSEASAAYVHAQMQITIQDASGRPQTAQAMAQILQREGFKNVTTAPPWPDTLRETRILVQNGDFGSGAALRRRLGLGQVEVMFAGVIGSELTIRVGTDWPTP